MLDIEIKKPPVLADRGRKIRGTTSGLVASHGATLTASNNALRNLGRTRPSLLDFQEGHSGRYFGGFSHCLAPTGSSLAEKGSLTCSHHCVENILTKIVYFVKTSFLFSPPQQGQKDVSFRQQSISSALLRVVSVILVPPMIRASSRFRPSRSRGVTEV